MKKVIVVLLMSVAMNLFSGCAPLRPVPFVMPSNTDKPEDFPKALGPDLKKAMADIITQVHTYEGAWANASDTLDEIKFASDETTFYGAITAAISGIVKSPEGAIVGTAIAGAAGLFNNHYALAVQSRNYRHASDAMGCIYDAANEIPNEFWNTVFNDDGSNNIPQGKAGRDVVMSIPNKMNNAIRTITSRLRTVQYAVQLLTPKVADIKNAFEQANQQQKDAASDKNLKDLSELTNENFKITKSRTGISVLSTDPAYSKDTWEKVLLLPGEIDKCVAAFGK